MAAVVAVDTVAGNSFVSEYPRLRHLTGSLHAPWDAVNLPAS